MRKSSKAKGGTLSDAIRKVFSGQPDAKVSQVQDALQKQGIKASNALINKIKYGGQQRGGKKKRRPRGAGANGSKADAIRAKLDTMGSAVRNRDVVAALGSEGIKVSSAQVSNLRKALKNGRKSAAIDHAVSFENLLAAKVLVERVGSVELARRALNDLARLI